MQKGKIILGFCFGVLATLLIIFFLKNKKADNSTHSDYYILKNQISKMNKLVVLEQDFSTLQKTAIDYKILGKKISEKEILTFTKTNAQVSYDLDKMILDVDSINKKLIIKQLPNPSIRIIPSVEIQSIDDSFMNRIQDEDIRKVTQTAKNDAHKRVDQKKLESEGKKQLMENLNSIFVLAKALNYKIEDQTNYINSSLL